MVATKLKVQIQELESEEELNKQKCQRKLIELFKEERKDSARESCLNRGEYSLFA